MSCFFCFFVALLLKDLSFEVYWYFLGGSFISKSKILEFLVDIVHFSAVASKPSAASRADPTRGGRCFAMVVSHSKQRGEEKETYLYLQVGLRDWKPPFLSVANKFRERFYLS